MQQNRCCFVVFVFVFVVVVDRLGVVLLIMSIYLDYHIRTHHVLFEVSYQFLILFHSLYAYYVHKIVLLIISVQSVDVTMILLILFLMYHVYRTEKVLRNNDCGELMMMMNLVDDDDGDRKIATDDRRRDHKKRGGGVRTARTEPTRWTWILWGLLTFDFVG